MEIAMMLRQMYHPHSPHKALHAFRAWTTKASFSSFTCPWRSCNQSNESRKHPHRYVTGIGTFHNARKVSVCLVSHFISNNTNGKSFARGCTGSNKVHFNNQRIRRDKIVVVAKSYSSATMSGKGPGLVVFDLDCTLWPVHVDTTVNPPFVMKGSKVFDQDGVEITPYPEVPKVLEYLKSEGFIIGAASRTTKPPAAEQLLQFFDWNKYFSYKEIYPGSKVTHFTKFVERTKIPHEQMLFFDDEQRNIIDMKKEGVKCVFVTNGVNLQLVQDSIEKFKKGEL